ncbi:MAG: ACP S-malonyltransferase [Gammaproteobacteria bacterium]|nr:ACP S-malonyltransferase [Gammaproteobacteria bacterium]
MSADRELAFVFPGQGSQSVGMLADLAAVHPVVGQTFDAANAALGIDLWGMILNGPEEQLNLTFNTQPALLAAAVAVWRAWHNAGGPEPALLAGHSLGEYSALVCADSISLEDAVRLVAERGRCMQNAVPAGTGAMAAILGLDDQAIAAACAEAAEQEIVTAVNFNAPGQVVIAGHRAAVERAIKAAGARGARRALPLPVSIPGHCALMQPAADAFQKLLDKVAFRDARIPVIQNVDAVARRDADGLRSALIRQLYSPVRWVECVHAMRRQGIRRIIECGPGRVLTGLIKRIEGGLRLDAIGDPSGFAGALAGGHA